MRKINRLRAQSTLEYAILISVIVGALLTMNVYIKRGIQGRFKTSADDIGDQFSIPLNGLVTITQNAYQRTNEVQSGSTSTSKLIEAATQNRAESMNLTGNAEYWGK